MQLKPFNNARIFWDVYVSTLDYDSKAAFIIERVFERGDVEDIRQCRKYYSTDIIEKVLLNCKYLPVLRLHLASAIIERPIAQFRCSNSKQLNPELLPY